MILTRGGLIMCLATPPFIRRFWHRGDGATVPDHIHTLLFYCISLSSALALFNILPAFMLDGQFAIAVRCLKISPFFRFLYRYTLHFGFVSPTTLPLWNKALFEAVGGRLGGGGAAFIVQYSASLLFVANVAVAAVQSLQGAYNT